MQTTTTTKTWPDILRDLCWIVEWAERFPHEHTDKVLAWANAEITRIGEALENLPAEHKLQLPSAEDYAFAIENA